MLPRCVADFGEASSQLAWRLMSCRLLRAHWQWESSHYACAAKTIAELFLFTDSPNPASSKGAATLEKSEMPWLPFSVTNRVCFLLGALLQTRQGILPSGLMGQWLCAKHKERKVGFFSSACSYLIPFQMPNPQQKL